MIKRSLKGMENTLKIKYDIWLEEEKNIKREEIKLSVYVTLVILGWGLPLMFVKNKAEMLSITPIFLIAYIYILVKLKKLNNHMLCLLREMVLIKDKIKVNEENKDLISTIKGLELYYLSTKTFSTFERIMKK